ncbi:type II secretion system F family protein [Geodermatophilaceae bacterium NBWT11]|nr:type II secretion system F family protein [Geodermatophilaceae bacterium NBWT11]
MTGAPLALLALALLAWPRPPGTAGRRLGPRQPAVPPDDPPPGVVRRWAVGALAGLVVPLLAGPGPVSLLCAVAVAVGVERVTRRAGAPPDPAGPVRADLPVACELLAVCLAGGTPVAGAVGAVGTALGGPLGTAMQTVAARYRLGASPRAAWSDVPPTAAALARTVVRAGESGSAVVPALRRLADDARVTERADTAAAVQRAGVWVLAPLGLCFLPAFLCLGVAPLVLGIAADVFG